MKALKKGIDMLLIVYLSLLAVLAVPPWFGLRVYTVLSPSMEPEIKTGSVVYVRHEAYADISVGDVVTFPMGEGGACATHRVVEKKEPEQTLVTKGDANAQADGREVSYAEVVGTVKFTVPYLGYLAILTKGMEEKIMLLGMLVWLLFAQAMLADVLKVRQEGVDIL